MAGRTPEQNITGNVIPIHYNADPFTPINIRVPPKLPKYPLSSRLGPLGTMSAFGMLPNLANRPRNVVNSVIRASGAMNEPPMPPPLSSSPPPPPPPPPPPLPPSTVPAPVNNNNYSSFYNAAYNVPDWQKPPPPEQYWIEYLQNDGRLYREQFTKEDWRRVWDFVDFHRAKYNIKYWSADNKTGKKEPHPYFYIPKRKGGETRRKRKQSRRHRK